MKDEEARIEQLYNEEEAKMKELEQRIYKKNEYLQKLKAYYDDFGNFPIYRNQNDLDKATIQTNVDKFREKILQYQYSNVTSDVYSKKIQNARLILNNLFKASTKLKENRDEILKVCREVDNASKAIKQELDSIVDVTVSDIKKSISENSSVRESLIKAEVKLDFQNYEDTIRTSAKYAKREQLKTNIAIAKAELIVYEAKMKSINLQKELLLGNKALVQIASHVDSLKEVFTDKQVIEALRKQLPANQDPSFAYFESLKQYITFSRQLKDQLLKDRKVLTDAIEQYANAYKVLTPIYMKTATSNLNCKLTHDENTIRIKMLDNKSKRYGELIDEGKKKLMAIKHDTEKFQKLTADYTNSITQQKQDMAEMEKYGFSGSHSDKQMSEESVKQRFAASQEEKANACDRFIKNVNKLMSDMNTVSDGDVKVLIKQIKDSFSSIKNSAARKDYEKAELEEVAKRCVFAKDQLAKHPTAANPGFINMYYQTNLELEYDDEMQRFYVKAGKPGYLIQALLFPQNDDIAFHCAFVQKLNFCPQTDINACIRALAKVGRSIIEKDALPIAPLLPVVESYEAKKLLPIFEQYDSEKSLVVDQLARFFWVFAHIAPNLLQKLDEESRREMLVFASAWKSNGQELIFRFKDGRPLNEKHPFFPGPFKPPKEGTSDSITPAVIYSYYTRQALKEYKSMTYEMFLSTENTGIFLLRLEFIKNVKKELNARLNAKNTLKISEIAELCLTGHNFFLYHALQSIADDARVDRTIANDFNTIRRKPDDLESEENELIRRFLEAPIDGAPSEFFIPDIFKYKTKIGEIFSKDKKPNFEAQRTIGNYLAMAFCAANCGFDPNVKVSYGNPFGSSEKSSKKSRK